MPTLITAPAEVQYTARRAIFNLAAIVATFVSFLFSWAVFGNETTRPWIGILYFGFGVFFLVKPVLSDHRARLSAASLIGLVAVAIVGPVVIGLLARSLPSLGGFSLNVQTFAIEPRDWLMEHHGVPLDVQAPWLKACNTAIELIAAAVDWDGAGGKKPSQYRQIRLHGDCHPGNILWTPDHGPHFVDLDDARTGPAVQDLWMLLSGDRAQRQKQLGALVDGYEQFREFDRAELALIEPLRTLRLIHYSAWLARRWDDPAFPAAFPWFGSSDYWQGQVQMLEEQIEAMEEPPLVA